MRKKRFEKTSKLNREGDDHFYTESTTISAKIVAQCFLAVCFRLRCRGKM